MKGEERIELPKPEHWSDELNDGLNNIQLSSDSDIWKEIEKLEENTIKFFNGFF